MDNSQHQLLARVASLYYEQEMTQNAIAKEMGLSRVKIYRLLKQAKKKRVVQIQISWPIERNVQLEQSLKEDFGLKEALVLRTTASPNNTPVLRQLGQLGAQYLEQVLQDGMTLAMCMGKSTFEVIDAISPDFHARIRVAQATGSIPFASREQDSATMARQLAQKLGGQVLYLSSPFIADSVEAAGVLRSQQNIKHTLVTAGQSNVALVGIGNLDPDASGFVKAGVISREILADLIDDGAVGDMAGQIFNLTGQPHPTPYNQRIIGITFDDLCAIPNVIAVARGREKTRAIVGALSTCTIKVFITDDTTAREILKFNRGA